MDSQFDRLQSQVVDLAAEVNRISRHLDKLEKPAIESEQPEPGRWEHVTGDAWNFYRPGTRRRCFKVFDTTPDDRAKILAAFDPELVTISKTVHAALCMLAKEVHGVESWTNLAVTESLRALDAARKGK